MNEEAGLKIISKGSKKIPYGVPNKCGIPTGEANVIVVDAIEWSNFVKKQPGTLGYGVWVFDRATVEVYKYDGTLQCEQGKEVPLETMAKELTAKGIEVKSSRKGRDGLLHIAVCGASTGSLNVYSISIDFLGKAQELGFKGLITQKMTNDIKSPGYARRGPAQSRSAPRGIADTATQVPRIW